MLVVSASRGATRMEVRRGSQQGDLVFSGTVENGRQQSFELDERLWLWVQRPARVDFEVAGRAVRPPARLLLVDATGVRRAPAAR